MVSHMASWTYYFAFTDGSHGRLCRIAEMDQTKRKRMFDHTLEARVEAI